MRPSIKSKHNIAYVLFSVLNDRFYSLYITEYFRGPKNYYRSNVSTLIMYFIFSFLGISRLNHPRYRHYLYKVQIRPSLNIPHSGSFFRLQLIMPQTFSPKHCSQTRVTIGTLSEAYTKNAHNPSIQIGMC